MLKAEPGVLTANSLLDVSDEVILHGGIRLRRIETEVWNGQRRNWIITCGGYLLSRYGWRRFQGNPGDYDEITSHEFQCCPSRFLFRTAVEAADFALCRCSEHDAEPPFNLKLVRLRDYVANRFDESQWQAIFKSVCSMKRK